MNQVRLTREQVYDLCPECAREMKQHGIKALKLHIADPSSGNDPSFQFFDDHDSEVKSYSGFSQGLCKRFGGDEGFFTRCAETMAGKVDDEKGFCASLHKFCIGKWPSEKKHDEHTVDELMTYSNAIKGVEIFKSGVHNGDEYTERDLDEIILAFKELDYSPAIKVGHTKDEPGGPAYGWVRNLRRVGDKLYADFEDMHDDVVDAIRKRAYDRVSSEIYFNLNRNGKQYKRALKAVALLGAEVPAVANLTPLHKILSIDSGFEAINAFEQELDVPVETLMVSLAERVAGLVNLMKESDMAKNAEQVKELKAKVDEFRTKMDEMMKKKGKEQKDMMDDEEYKQLAVQAQEISDRIAVLEAEDDDSADRVEELREQLAESKAREEKMASELKALSERTARIEQEKRHAEIGDRVAKCKIPVFRPGLQALYAYALSHAAETVKVYAADGKSEDKTLADVVDTFVSGINEQSEKLFKALAYSGQAEREDGIVDDNPSVALDQKIKAYRAKHPEVKTYAEAMSAVMKEDAELAKRYRESLGQGS